jgi:hypothetical protein
MSAQNIADFRLFSRNLDTNAQDLWRRQPTLRAEPQLK